jgi:hypothetical protein
MIVAEDVRRMAELLGDVAREDIAWSETIGLPATAEEFAGEAIWVICNSGMKHTVARIIQSRVNAALRAGTPVFDVFKHAGKAQAMETIDRDRERLFAEFLAAEDKLAYCETLPWIGGITKYHLAKNYGLDVAKPDVHLQRLADLEGTTAQALCERLAPELGWRIATVDLVIWRACATGILNSRTGRFADPKPVAPQAA